MAGGLKIWSVVFGFISRFHDDGQTLFLAHFVQGKNGSAQHMRRFVQRVIVEDFIQLSGLTLIVRY